MVIRKDKMDYLTVTFLKILFKRLRIGYSGYKNNSAIGRILIFLIEYFQDLYVSKTGTGGLYINEVK